MNTNLRGTLIILGTVIVSTALIVGGVFIGRAGANVNTIGPGFMMNGYTPAQAGDAQSSFAYGMGPGMMSGYNQDGYGMMNGGMMGGMVSGYNSGLYNVEPLSIDQARQAVEDYLASLGDADLVVRDVMIFDNHAYAQIVEQSTGIGAMEVLIDPRTLAVYPEHGPNMMWNLKYSPMSDFDSMGMMNMMGRGFTFEPQSDVSADMPVGPDEAIAAAQQYLDTALPGTRVDDHAEPFYGYYTLHILRDGQVAGMLSVNGFSKQVFLHTWHGDFVEMSEA